MQKSSSCHMASFFFHFTVFILALACAMHVYHKKKKNNFLSKFLCICNFTYKNFSLKYRQCIEREPLWRKGTHMEKVWQFPLFFSSFRIWLLFIYFGVQSYYRYTDNRYVQLYIDPYLFFFKNLDGTREIVLDIIRVHH